MSALGGKGLGQGLEALLGEGTLGESASDFEYVPVSRLEPRQGQPRTVFDEVSLRELADSIAEHGVLQPLTVRPLTDGYYQIIAGERRWRAARLAGLDQVPVRIFSADDRKTAELALIENLQREDLNPLEEARGYRDLMTGYGLTQEETAAVVGKSRSVVANAIRLLNLPDEIQAMLEDGSLAPGAARALLAIPEGKAQREAAEKVVRDGLSVRQTETLAKKVAEEIEKKGKTARKKRTSSIYIDEVCRTLEQAMGRKVSVTGGGRRGKIVLEYYDTDDFEELYDILKQLKGRS
ncbi:MAG: ParB/RepB/Spo0J family partition protein [Oscillospiraceae bacterium]|nr:ParB/RepB/Spo0J family partition protein [Oscillospiraceae bacterium]